MTTPSPPSPAPVANPRKAALAAWVGSALEYYDFLLYGTAAALVFPTVFFPDADPAVATLLSLTTFGVGYVARPVGAIVLGHLGDRHGRKNVLIATILLMGAATLLIGCLPSYDDIGLLAPGLLVALRLLQGFSAGGEQAGANSMTLEHAPDHRRGYYTSFTLGGTQVGQILATAAFLPVAALPDEQLYSWGWRVPFWASAIVVLAAFLIRRTLDETPVFHDQLEVAGRRRKTPLVELLSQHWGAVLRVVCAALIASVSTLFTVYALNYATNTVGIERTTMLWVGILANVVAVVTIPIWGHASDRFGRKPVFLIGSIGSTVMLPLYFLAISTGRLPLVFLTGILSFGLVYSAANATWPSFYGEMFPARVRMTGMALGTQIGFAIAGFAPAITGAIAPEGVNAWHGAALVGAGFCLVNIVAVLSGKETHRVPTLQLGERTAEPVVADRV